MRKVFLFFTKKSEKSSMVFLPSGAGEHIQRPIYQFQILSTTRETDFGICNRCRETMPKSRLLKASTFVQSEINRMKQWCGTWLAICVMIRVTKTWTGHNSKFHPIFLFYFCHHLHYWLFRLNKENISGPIFSNPQYFLDCFSFKEITSVKANYFVIWTAAVY